jgi:hypothetical protein
MAAARALLALDAGEPVAPSGAPIINVIGGDLDADAG